MAAAVYMVPDLDLKVHIWINSTETRKPLACLEVDLGTGKTVHQKAVGWTMYASALSDKGICTDVRSERLLYSSALFCRLSFPASAIRIQPRISLRTLYHYSAISKVRL
jgi:hypothetical protein